MTNESMAMAEPAAERLQGALDRLAHGEPLEQVVAELGAEPELAALVALGGRMVAALPTEAPRAMRQRQEVLLRRRMAELTALTPDAASPRYRGFGWRRWLVLPRPAVSFAAVVLACAALGATGAAVAAASSLPGDALYGVKRVVETTRLAVTFDPVDRVALRLAFAGERLDEIRALIDRGVMPAPEVIEDLIALYQASLRDAAEGDVPAALIDQRRAASAAALGALGRDAAPAVQEWLASAAARLAGEPPSGASTAPTPLRGTPGSGGDARSSVGRIAPTVARPLEPTPGDGSVSPAEPTAARPIALTVSPPTATPAAWPGAPVPASPTPESGSGGEPVIPPPPSPPGGDPPVEATAVPQDAPTSSIEEQRRRDLNNTPAPPPPPPPGGPHGGGPRPRP